jgi:PBP1b-binding outer membrane lipoprotein LpoB
MKRFDEFLTKHWTKIVLILLITIFVNTCSNPNKTVNKRIDSLSVKVDSLTTEINTIKASTLTKTDLQIEGLKVEKRMIQSTDRRILDVNRQSEIDQELKKLEGK